MSFLGANDDDDGADIRIIRAPKAPIAAPKPFVADGAPTVTRYPIRLSDYRRVRGGTAATANSNAVAVAASSSADSHRDVCLVIDKKDLVTILGDGAEAEGGGSSDAVQPPALTFTPSALEGGNGTIDVAVPLLPPIPFAANVISTVPSDATTSAAAMGISAEGANSSSSGVFAVNRVEGAASASPPSSSSAAALVLTPVEFIWRTRRMVELETANSGDGGGGGLSKAWALGIEVMDKRDSKVSAEVAHYDDAIEEAGPSTTIDVVAQFEKEAKKMQSALDEMKSGSRLAKKSAAPAASTSQVGATSAAKRASDAPTAAAAPPAEKKIRFELSTPPTPVVAAPAQPVVAAQQPLPESVETIVARLVAAEKQKDMSHPCTVEAGKFVSLILKSLPDFAAIAAAKDKAKEVEWLKTAKARVLAALKALGCEIANGKIVLG